MPEPLDEIQPLADGAAATYWCAWTLERQIWYLRSKLNLTQSEFAKTAGITQAKLSRIEAGEDPRWSVIRKLFLAAGHEPLLLPGPWNLSREGRPFRRKIRPGK
jgi:transcriptional regulator with XRE-family HTH domain